LAYVITAVYPDTRAVSIEANGTPFDAATIRSVVTAAELAELLP